MMQFFHKQAFCVHITRVISQLFFIRMLLLEVCLIIIGILMIGKRLTAVVREVIEEKKRKLG